MSEERNLRCYGCNWLWKESELIDGYKCPNCGATQQEPQDG